MIHKEFNNLFQWRLTPSVERELLPDGGKLELNPNIKNGTMVFDKTKLVELVETGNLDKIKAYLDQCGKSYIIDDSDPNKTAITVDNMTVYVHKTSNPTENKTDIKTLVNQYVETWVNDFKTGYKRNRS